MVKPQLQTPLICLGGTFFAGSMPQCSSATSGFDLLRSLQKSCVSIFEVQLSNVALAHAVFTRSWNVWLLMTLLLSVSKSTSSEAGDAAMEVFWWDARKALREATLTAPMPGAREREARSKPMTPVINTLRNYVDRREPRARDAQEVTR